MAGTTVSVHSSEDFFNHEKLSATDTLVNARRNQKVKLCHGWMDDGTCNYSRRYVVNQTSKASN